ncbi:MAG: hypothetical protein JSV67_02195 [Thermoplasmatales archaeon]|nr:MAG: hypothetical protein JSV67_02195 [Thermoplasmatales archaeon]
MDQLTTIDNLTFTFIPKSDLADGAYILNITSQDMDSNSITSSASYNIQSIEEKPSEEKRDERLPWLITLIVVIIIILIIIALFKKGYLYIE